MVAYKGRTYGALIPVTINILPNGRACSTLKMKRDNQKWRGGKPAHNSNKFFVTIHLKLSIIYGLSIPKAPTIYLTPKLQCKQQKVYRTAYFPGQPGQAWWKENLAIFR